MELEHSFTIPVPLEQAWETLLDVEQVAPCMPGATVDSVAGEEITGRIKVKVGPVTLTYAGKAHFRERDADAHAVTLEASGRETRGAGTATATVRSMLRGEGDQTQVVVHTTLAVTGRPAQFGRGMLTEVGGRIIDKFAANLAAQLAGGQVAAGAGAMAGPAAASPVLGTPVGELDLPTRAIASLRLAGLTTVGDLAASNEQTLLGLAGIGPQTISQIRAKLSALGVAFGGTAPAPGGEQPAPAGQPPPMAPPRPLRPPDEEAIDLLNVAGLPVLKRIVPAAGVAVFLVALVLMVLRRRRAGRRPAGPG